MAFVLYKAGLNNIYNTFADSNKLLLILASFLTIIVVVAKAIRWKFILKKLDYDISIKNASQYFCVGMYGATLTPGKVGDLLRAHTLRKKRRCPIYTRSFFCYHGSPYRSSCGIFSHVLWNYFDISKPRR